MSKYRSKVFIVLLSVLALPLFAQSVSVYNIDRSSTTTVKANIRVVDKDGNRINDLSADDFIVIENGKQRKVTLYTCPPETPSAPFSAALSIDVSSSMKEVFNGARSIDYAKSTSKHLLNAFSMPPVEAALQQCNSFPDIVSDFTSDRNALLTKLAVVEANGSNNFTEHLLNQHSGLLWVAANGRYKRNAILLTDAYFGSLSPEALQRCLDVCAQFDITLYAVLFNDQARRSGGFRESLQQLTNATGGWFREGVITEAEAVKIARELSGELAGSPPCRIEWETDEICDPSIVTDVIIKKYSLSTRITRLNPVANGQLEILPSAIRFGMVTPPLTGERKVRLQAVGGGVTVKSLAVAHPAFSIKNNPAPFTIPANTSTDITLVYTPTDTTFISGYLKASIDYCDDSLELSIPVSAGVAPVYDLRIVKPAGGNIFVAGEDTVIEWKGVDPSDPVKLEYSTDGGLVWAILEDSAIGLSYDWRVPLPASTQCRVRASLVEEVDISAYEFTLVGRYRVFDSLGLSPTYAEISPDNKQVMVSADGIHLYDASTANLQYSYTAVKTTAAVPPTYVQNGTRIIGCGGSTIFALRNTGGAPVWMKTTAPITSLSVSPAHNMVATTSQGGPVEVWSIANGTKLHTLSGHIGDATNSVFNKYSTQLATAGLDKTARVWDLASGAEIAQVTVNGSSCSGLLFDPGSTDLFTSTPEGKLTSWDLSTSSLWYEMDLTMTSPNRLVFNDSRSVLLAGSSVSPVQRAWKVSGSAYKLDLNISDGFTNWNVRPPMTTDGKLILHRTYQTPTIAGVWHTGGDMIVGELTHPGIVRSATFSDDAHYIVTTTDRDVFLWQMSHALDTGRKIDTTGFFTVIAPEATAIDVDMGGVLVGGKRDSVVTAFIRNTGTARVRIDSITITGTDAADFLLQSLPAELIEPGQGAEVEFAFTPSAVGLRSANVNVHARTGTLQQSITGTGVLPSLQTLGNVVDFGLHPLGATYDSTLAVAVTNVGSTAIDIVSTDILGPDKDQFSIVSGGGSFTLQPGQSQQMVLRFSAQRIGRSTSNIGFAFNGVGSPAVLRLFGRGLGGKVYIADDSAAVGEIVNIALLLGGPKKYIQDDATKFTAEVSFDASVLTPMDAAARGTVNNGVQTITVSQLWSGASDTLAVIPMRVGLGRSEQTMLTIPSFTWLDEFDAVVPVSIDLGAGTFTLKDLCEAGGKRLFDPEGSVTMSITPNPAMGGAVSIRYNTIEEGPTTLTIYNALGGVVKEVTTYEPMLSIEEVSSTMLTNGIYHCVLRTPTARIGQKFSVQK